MGDTVKGLLFFVALTVVIVSAIVGLPILRDHDRQLEDRLIGASSALEGAVAASLGARADFYQPALEPGPEPGQWTLTGIVRVTEKTGSAGRASLSAILDNGCTGPGEAGDEDVGKAGPWATGCWRLVAITVEAGIESLSSWAESFETDQAAVPVWSAAEIDPPAVETLAASPDVPDSSDLDVIFDGGEPGVAAAVVTERDLVRLIQESLARMAYDPGPPDGRLGSRTAAAIKAYQRDFRLSPDGQPSRELFQDLQQRLHGIEPRHNS